MSVKVEFHGDKFEQAFLDAVGKEVVKSAAIFRRNLSTVLRTTGKARKVKDKSAPWGYRYEGSPDGSDIPFNFTGTLARSWMSSSKPEFLHGKIRAKVGTNTKYAEFLITKAKKGKKGGRDYLKSSLGWMKKTRQMILARLETKRLVSEAVRSMK
tara:strand:- start:1122 stop:1586 length:465 start_codon:yes stop_codon:yes gene_type:complete